MKILIINEFVQLGGAEQIVQNQLEILKQHGHHVECLCFNYGDIEPNKIDHNNYHIIECKSLINKLVFNPFLFWKVRRWIVKFNPDKIIVHSIWSSPLTQYRALKGYEAIQIIHDYYPVCPNSLCVKLTGDKKVCSGYKCGQCIKQCQENGSKIQLAVKLCQLKICEPIRKKYIRLFVSPSQKLKSYLEKYGYDTICINNPLGDIPLQNPNKKFNAYSKKYIYAGGINTQKGILDFMHVFIDYAKNKTVTLDIFGMINDDSIRVEFFQLINDSEGKIVYKGKVSNHEVREALMEADYMVMPSLWMENYPTSVLEAMATGTVVIGSNRGGIPEMISEKGFVYDFGSRESLSSILEQSYAITEKTYMKYSVDAYESIKKYNSFEVYYNEIISLLGERT